MKHALSLLLVFPLLAFADGERGIEALETISDLGEACEFYPHGNAKMQFQKPGEAYLAGLCVGFVKAQIEVWLRDRYKHCGLTPGASLDPVFAAIRKTYRIRTLRDPDQEAMWFVSSAAGLLQEAVFAEWEQRLNPSDCPRGFIDPLLSGTTDKSP